MTKFEEMKIRSAFKYLIFKISDDKKSIVLEETGKKDADFSEFTTKLPDGDCRYAVLDVEINTKSGAMANKLIFVAWSDDNASVKPKMLYASSKDALKKGLSGINEEYQATDRADLDLAEIKKKAGARRRSARSLARRNSARHALRSRARAHPLRTPPPPPSQGISPEPQAAAPRRQSWQTAHALLACASLHSQYVG